MEAPFKKILTPLFISFIILSITPASCTSAGTNSSPSTERIAEKPKSWVIEYSVSGGFAGIHHQLTLSKDGRLTVTNQKTMKHVELQASQEQLAKITGILEQLNFSVDTKTPSKLSGHCADCFQYSLTLTANSRKGAIILNDLSLNDSKYAVLIRLLSTMMDQALKK